MKKFKDNPLIKIVHENMMTDVANGLVRGGTAASNVGNALLNSNDPSDRTTVTNDGDTASLLAKIYGGSMITGVTSKIIKDMQITNSIVNKYPNPMDLKARLEKINHISAKMLAARLNEDTSYEEYRALIRKYICKSSPGKYLLHAILGPVSTIMNVTKAINSDFVTPDDNIGGNL